MSHPLGYEEGSGKFQSTIPRCKHGVYIPFGKGATSSACDGCVLVMSEEKQRERKDVNVASADSIEDSNEVVEGPEEADRLMQIDDRHRGRA